MAKPFRLKDGAMLVGSGRQGQPDVCLPVAPVQLRNVNQFAQFLRPDPC
jgi:hypothetical protein